MVESIGPRTGGPLLALLLPNQRWLVCFDRGPWALKVYAILMAHISARMMDLNPINYVN